MGGHEEDDGGEPPASRRDGSLCDGRFIEAGIEAWTEAGIEVGFERLALPFLIIKLDL